MLVKFPYFSGKALVMGGEFEDKIWREYFDIPKYKTFANGQRIQ